MYDETPSIWIEPVIVTRKLSERVLRSDFMIENDGVIRDTVEGMIGAKAGLGPGMKIVAVNGRRFSADGWHDAIREAKTNSSPIEVIVENTEYFRVVKLDYHEGEEYPPW